MAVRVQIIYPGLRLLADLTTKGMAGKPSQTYAYPSKTNFGEQKVQPTEAFYSPEMGEFFLKYEDVQKSANPE